MRKNLASALSQQRHQAFEVLHLITNACTEAKGRDLKVLNVSELFGLSDYFVIVSGRSDRQVQGIANRILESLEKAGVETPQVEGMDQCHWVLIDCGDMVVHIFYEPVREHYGIENLWGQAKQVPL